MCRSLLALILVLCATGAFAQSQNCGNNGQGQGGAPCAPDQTLPPLPPPRPGQPLPPQSPSPLPPEPPLAPVPGEPTPPPVPEVPIVEVPGLTPPEQEIAEAIPPDSALDDAIRRLPRIGDVWNVLDQFLSSIPTAATTEAAIENSGNSRDAIDAALDRVVAEDLGEGDNDEKSWDLLNPIRYGPNFTIWSQGFANWSNKPTSTGSAGGVFVGADTLLLDNKLVLGIIGGYDVSRSILENSTIVGDSWTAGAYSALILRPWTFRLGGTYTWTDSHADRRVQFPGFEDFATLDYNSTMGQVFGGIVYHYTSGPVAWDPYVDLAWVNVNVDDFTAPGSPLAFRVNSHSSDTLISTLGLRATYKFDDWKIKTRIGWRRTFGELNLIDTVLINPSNNIAIGNAFDIPGSSIAKDIALFDLGFEVQLTPAASFSLMYNGQFAKDEYKNGLTGLLRMKF